MRFEGRIYRPPAEADSTLLQVTVGCSHNKCAFCVMYDDKKYRPRPLEDIFKDIAELAVHLPHTKRVFLCDGNALHIGFEDFRLICERLIQTFPQLRRIASYANAGDVLALSEEELKELRALKFSLIYLGFESGSARVLEFLRKDSSPQEMIAAHEKAAKSGIKMSVIGLLGAGGKALSEDHVRETIRVLNIMKPGILSFLTMIVVDGSILERWTSQGDFEPLWEGGTLSELRTIIKGLNLKATVLRANHRSNLYPVEGRLPKDKTRLIDEIDEDIKRLSDPAFNQI